MLVAKETADCDMIGVRLAPAVAARLLGVPVSELVGQLVDLEGLWPDADAILDRLAAAEPAERTSILERALAERLGRASRAIAAQEIVRTRELVRGVSEAVAGGSIGRLAGELGITNRAVIAACLAQTGLRPKTYQRVARLRRVFRLIEDERLGLAAVALQAGYYDQAHLANEFRQLTGLTPTQYLARRSWVSEGVLPYRLAAPASIG